MSFRKFINGGEPPVDTSPEDQMYYRITHQLNLGLIFAIAIPAAAAGILFANSPQSNLVRLELVVVFSILNIFLNKKGYFKMAKIMTIAVPLLFINVLPFVLNTLNEGILLWSPYGIMGVGMFSFSLFSYQKERSYLLIATVISFLFSIFYDQLYMARSAESIHIDFIERHYFAYKEPLIIIWFIILFNLFFLKRANYYYQLRQANINAELEQKVAERTEKLNQKNKQILEVAFTNAHEVRAIIVRIEGLANIFEMDISESDKEECRKKIIEDIRKLNTITTEFSHKLVVE